MTEISAGNQLATALDIFTVQPDKQEALICKLGDFTQSIASKQPGFVAANILKSLDGVCVTGYVQSASADDYQAALSSPESQQNSSTLQKLIESVDHNLYEDAFTNGKEAVIGKPSDCTTLINLFSVATGGQPSLLKALIEFIDPIMRQQSGYLSTNFHRSLDEPRVFNYSYWESP